MKIGDTNKIIASIIATTIDREGYSHRSQYSRNIS